MEKFKQTLAGVGGALLLIFAIVASITLNSTSYSVGGENSSSAPETSTPKVTTKAPETTPPSTTKPQTTTTATKAPETTVPVTTEPLEWSEEPVSGTMYVVQGCYSRARAIVGSDAVNQYSYGDAVTVVAVTDTGYYKLGDGEYIHGDYLTENAL